MDKVVKSATEFNVSSSLKEHLDDTFGEYCSYLDKLFSLDEKTLLFYLKTVKDREIVNNQQAELEESFLIELYKHYQRKDSIEIAMKHFEDGCMTKDELKKLHRVVIKGSRDDEEKNYDYRCDGDIWVGSFDLAGNRQVDYYPPDAQDVNHLVDYTLGYLNDSSDFSQNDILIRPFIAHALLAYIQPFKNGNTRVARVIQHAKIWDMTNRLLGINLPLPALYLSRNYLLTRPTYRKLLTNIAINQNLESWINYNLNMTDEQLYYSNGNLDSVRKLLM